VRDAVGWAFRGNRLGRHGQGEDVIEVPKDYARLAIEIAAAFLNFITARLENQAEPEITDEDIPF
jgi:hypothetical protein